ncbi:MAG: hypothetical protein AAGA56_22765 [Myxococcota bacterium]
MVRRRRIRRGFALSGLVFALAGAGWAAFAAGYGWLVVFLGLAVAVPLGAVFLGSSLEPHGEEPPLRHN